MRRQVLLFRLLTSMNIRRQISPDKLVERFEEIYRRQMQDLAFVNNTLQVEAIGFRDFGDLKLGVLITPWFMNLVMAPTAGNDSMLEQGHKLEVHFPSGPIEFTATHDEILGYYLSAALFSSVLEIPNQSTARDLAEEIMRSLFDSEQNERRFSRRALFTQAGAD